MAEEKLDFSIERLGERRFPSPMQGVRFTSDSERILYPSRFEESKECIDVGADPPTLELVGPQKRVFFDPAAIACGIVTCGGLCPAINIVIRAVSLSLHHHYAAHTEAIGALNGIGLVKLMGLDSGFIAAYASLVDSQVNNCLVPEVSFTRAGFLRSLDERLARRGHAVVVMAEGAGQNLREPVYNVGLVRSGRGRSKGRGWRCSRLIQTGMTRCSARIPVRLSKIPSERGLAYDWH